MSEKKTKPRKPRKKRVAFNPNTHKLSSVTAVKKTARLLAKGESKASISRVMGVTPAAVGKFKERHIELIEKLQAEFMETALPIAQDTAIQMISGYNDPEVREGMTKVLQNHAHVHTMEALRSAGIYHGMGTTPAMVMNLTQNKIDKQIAVDVDPDDLYDTIMKGLGID